MSKIEYKPINKKKLLKEKQDKMIVKTHNKTTEQKLGILLDNDIPHLQVDIEDANNKLDYLVQAENERQSQKEFHRSNFHTKK